MAHQAGSAHDPRPIDGEGLTLRLVEDGMWGVVSTSLLDLETVEWSRRSYAPQSRTPSLSLFTDYIL